MKTRLSLGQVRVLGGLRLRTGEVLAQRTREIAYLHQHAVFPARHVVQPQAGRRQVVGNVTTRLVEQRAGDLLEGFHRGVTGDHLPLRLLRRILRMLLDLEGRRFLTPVPADHQRDQQIDTDQAAQSSGNQAAATATAP